MLFLYIWLTFSFINIGMLSAASHIGKKFDIPFKKRVVGSVVIFILGPFGFGGMLVLFFRD